MFNLIVHLVFDLALLFSGWVIARELIRNRRKIADRWLGSDEE